MLAYAPLKALDLDAVVAHLERPGGARIQRINGVRTLCVRANGDWHKVASAQDVRQALEDRLDLYDRLSSRFSETDPEDPLAELFSLSESEVARDDLMDHAASWGALIAESARGQLANAQTLSELWQDAATSHAVPLTDDDLANSAVRIRDSLSTVTAAIEGEMPWNVRTQGQGTLGMVRESSSGDLLARWFDADGAAQRAFSLLELLRHRFDLVGKFNDEALDLLTETAADALLDQSVLLPGFVVADGGSQDEHRRDRPREVRVAWQVPEHAAQPLVMER